MPTQANVTILPLEKQRGNAMRRSAGRWSLDNLVIGFAWHFAPGGRRRISPHSLPPSSPFVCSYASSPFNCLISLFLFSWSCLTRQDNETSLLRIPFALKVCAICLQGSESVVSFHYSSDAFLTFWSAPYIQWHVYQNAKHSQWKVSIATLVFFSGLQILMRMWSLCSRA